jgi:ABC-type uncharacterized transport system ATPase subunit
MSVVETGGSGAFSKEGGNAFSHGEIELVDMGMICSRPRVLLLSTPRCF